MNGCEVDDALIDKKLLFDSTSKKTSLNTSLQKQSLLKKQESDVKKNMMTCSNEVVRQLPPQASEDYPDTRWAFTMAPIGKANQVQTSAYQDQAKEDELVDIDILKNEYEESQSDEDEDDIRREGEAERQKSIDD